MIYRCSKCRYCRSVFPSDIEEAEFATICPPGDRWKFDSYYGAGRLELARGLIEGKIDFSERALHIIYTCTTCGACEEWCEVVKELYPLKVNEEMRIRAVELGVGPLPQHKEFAKSVEKNHNPYKEPHNERISFLKEKLNENKNAEIAYFIGCTSSYREKQIASNTVEILQKLGIDFRILGGEEWCCGSPLYRTGQVDLANNTLKHNLEVLEGLNVKKIIFTCPGCYKTFKEAHRYGIKSDIEFMHATEFLVDQLKDEKLKELEEFKGKVVTYHDPCHLGRSIGVYEPPREILNYMGLEIIEMPRNRKNAYCCGAGGGVKAAFPDYALWVANERLREVDYVGAEIVATACPFCVRNLRDAVRTKDNSTIEVFDVMEILNKAVK